MGSYCLRREVVDATDQRHERRRESFQFFFLVRAYGGVEDGDEAVCVGFGIEDWEERVVGECAGFFVLEVEVEKGVDEVGDGWLEGRRGDLDAGKEFEDWEKGFGEGGGVLGVELGDVEEKFEGLGKGQGVVRG